MSTPWSRAAALEKLRPELWRLLRASAVVTRLAGTRVAGPQLSEADLTRLIASHLGVRTTTIETVRACRSVLNAMPASVLRQNELTYALVRGRVDWARSFAAQRTTGDPTVFSCERVDRRYDTPLGRFLKSALTAVVQIRDLSGVRDARESAGLTLLGTALTRLATEARSALEHSKLRHVRAVDPNRLLHQESLCRRYPQLLPVAAFLDDYRRLRAADSLLLQKLLEEQVFAPVGDDAMFELQVGVDIISGLEAMGYAIDGPVALLVDAAASNMPFASLASESSWARVWWQRNAWSVTSVSNTEGRWWRTLTANAIERRQPLRPDFIVEGPDRIVLVEAKLTERDSFTPERDGLRDMFGYLYDLADARALLPPVSGLVAAWGATGRPANEKVEVAVCDQQSVSEVFADLWKRAPV